MAEPKSFFGLKGMKKYNEKTKKANITQASNRLKELKKLGLDNPFFEAELERASKITDLFEYNEQAREITYAFQAALRHHQAKVSNELLKLNDTVDKNPSRENRKKLSELERMYESLIRYNTEKTDERFEEGVAAVKEELEESAKGEEVKKPTLKERMEALTGASKEGAGKRTLKERMEEETNRMEAIISRAEEPLAAAGEVFGGKLTGEEMKEIEKESPRTLIRQLAMDESIEESIRNEHIDEPIDKKHDLHPIQAPVGPVIGFAPTPPIRKLPKGITTPVPTPDFNDLGSVSSDSAPNSPSVPTSPADPVPVDGSAPDPVDGSAPEPQVNTQAAPQATQSADTSMGGFGSNSSKVPKYHLFSIRLFFGSETEPKWNDVLAAQIYDWAEQTKMSKKLIKDLCDDIISKNGPDILVTNRKSDGDVQELVELIELQFALNKIGNGLGIIKLGQLEENIKASMGIGSTGSGISNLPADAITDNPFKSGMPLTDNRNLTKEQRLVQKNILEQQMVKEYINRERDDAGKPLTNYVMNQFVEQEKQQQANFKPALATDFYQILKTNSIKEPPSQNVSFGKSKEKSFDTIHI